MIEVHLRALENKLRNDYKEVKDIDHWNNQTVGDKIELFTPAVFFDFGKISWTNAGIGIKQGRASITAHCCGKNIRATKDKADDSNGKRLSRFDLSNKIMQVFENYSAKDVAGNYIIKSMQLDGSEHDTNHDGLYDDELTFTCTLYYYETWREKDWREIILQTVEDVVDATIVI